MVESPSIGRPKPKRLRDKLLQVRVTASELDEIAAAADRKGLSPASYARERLLGYEPPRTVRRPPLDRALAAQVLATLGPVGSDVRDVARRLEGGPLTIEDHEKLNAALVALAAMRDMVMRALRREP